MKRKKGKIKFNFKNPYHLYGFILFILGATQGGILGGLIGGVVAYILFRIGNDKTHSRSKKILYSFLATIGGAVIYLGLVYAIIVLIA